MLPVVQAQEPEDTPLLLGSEVRVDYHPQDFPEYKLYAPETSEDCTPENMKNSCGRVWWNSPQHPILAKQYVAQVPAMVHLKGPGEDVWWSPLAHCMIKRADGKRRSTSPPGTQCMTVIKSSEEHIEWSVGGVAENIDHTVPGTYTGTIPFTVTGPGTRWELDIPVVYTVHASSCTCSVSIPSGPQELDFGDVQIPSPDASPKLVKIGRDDQKNVQIVVEFRNCGVFYREQNRSDFPGDSGVSFDFIGRPTIVGDGTTEGTLTYSFGVQAEITSDAEPGPQEGEITFMISCSD